MADEREYHPILTEADRDVILHGLTLVIDDCRRTIAAVAGEPNGSAVISSNEARIAEVNAIFRKLD